jgi:uncharacterized protein (DUF1501 family)
MDRKHFLRAGLGTMCWGGIATYGAPLVRFAHVPGEKKLVFVLLRGGFDGLAAIVPTGDPAYQATRGAMAYDASALTRLADGFALAPGLARLGELWDANELVALHAMAIPFRTRSHFDGQAVLETGLGRPDLGADGWLNRLLQITDGRESAIAIAAGMPRSLMGPAQVATWSPAQLGAVNDEYLDRLHLLYRSDRVLANPFEAALQQGAIAGEMGGAGGGRSAARGARFGSIFSAAARLLRAPDAPNIAALEFSGWDTHRAQGMADGALDRLLAQLADGLLTFRREMGEDWRGTTVVVMTEFGRTARPNGTGGTDHGTAGAGLVLGTDLAGSSVLSDWPGLAGAQLFENRDLRPTLDTRAVLKGVIAGTFDLTAAQADRVFPGSADVRAVTDLMR